ncbi:MAG: metalloregulator ArsR/SmtB family transcription factor [Nitrospiraceae bacterium]|jgi:ArsR family transcriptional regulator|nr:metalloregulator ArsR/SmtB family transcription factor [Nitrospiraceae bacterium]OQW63859.1 MAG: transcriptional regulator [Nitrospira sp. ST-bin5]
MSTKRRVKAAALFHALSDETRLEVLNRLKRGEQCVCELTDALQAGQSRLSFHLRVLKEAGLIQDRPEGRWMYYSLSREGLEDLEDFIGELKKAITHSGSSKQCE